MCSHPATGNKAKKLATLDLVNVQFKVGPDDEPLPCLYRPTLLRVLLHMQPWRSLACGHVLHHSANSARRCGRALFDGHPATLPQVFFRLNTVRLCASLERAVASKGFLPLEQFPPAHQVPRKIEFYPCLLALPPAALLACSITVELAGLAAASSNKWPARPCLTSVSIVCCPQVTYGYYVGRLAIFDEDYVSVAPLLQRLVKCCQAPLSALGLL